MKLRRFAIVALLLAACGSGAPVYSTPEECAAAYLQALVDGNTTLIREMAAAANRDPAYNIGEQEEPEPTADIRSFVILGTDVRGDMATVDADVTLHDGTTHLFRILLIKNGDRWLLGRRAWMDESERR